ncbi:hypothetical protein WR25_05763 [Diploscapter pachys]|uniref:3-beta hydroxysteroid dehydrogenase/isomerase domain-containing protein n=1 Tax=Diploscapter pachys TaxID=2018661 RepID=A0A2A2KSJ6_9BILA|nr:hypothetical protein WR25_05763 [Diploscapter pachys]
MLYPPTASRRRSIAVLGGGSLLGKAVVRAIAEKEKTCFAKVIQLDVNAILADDSSSVLTDLIWMSRFFGGRIPRIGDGEGFLQMTYVENVADIVLKTADKLLANSTAVTPKYYSSTPRCKKPVFLNLSAYSPVKKIDFENVTADESKKAEGEGEQAMDSKLDGSVEVARDSYAAQFREGYQEFSLFGSFDDRDMLDYYESQLQGVLPAILYDSDDDIPGDTFSSGEFYEPLSIVIEETEEEEEESVIRKEIVLVADDTPKGNLFEVFGKVLQGKNGTRSTSLHIPFLPLYLLYFFLTSILQLINTVYPLHDLHRAFSILPHPNMFYLNFRHWTFFNTVKCNLLFGYTYKKSFEEAVATSLPHYNGMEPAHVQRFSWMPQEFNKHSHTKSTS